MGTYWPWPGWRRRRRPPARRSTRTNEGTSRPRILDRPHGHLQRHTGLHNVFPKAWEYHILVFGGYIVPPLPDRTFELFNLFESLLDELMKVLRSGNMLVI